MNSHGAVSVFIICRNEESRIGMAIQSVINWADEVIVVDSGSTDDTVKIAESCGAKVFSRVWDGYGPQKRFAQDLCRNEWVLNVDADEEVSPALALEIQKAISAVDEKCAAFRIRVTDVLPGEHRPSWYAYSYNVLRLYNRRFGQMSRHPYQDRVEIQTGNIQHLKGQIYHRSFRDWETTVAKINFYTTQVAADRAHRVAHVSAARLWTAFPWTFLKVWVLRRYIFRGSMGLAMSLTVAYLYLLRQLKTQEELARLQKGPVAPSEAAGTSGITATSLRDAA